MQVPGNENDNKDDLAPHYGVVIADGLNETLGVVLCYGEEDAKELDDRLTKLVNGEPIWIDVVKIYTEQEVIDSIINYGKDGSEVA